MTKPAQSAGLSFQARARNRSLRGAVLLCVMAGGLCAACGDSEGVYARYQLEKKFFRAQQVWSRAELQAESGQQPDTAIVLASHEAVLAEFSAARPALSAGDSTLFAYAARTAIQLIEAYSAEEKWQAAARYQEFIASDTLFPLAVRHRALFGWAESCERQGRVAEACALYRQLLASFYPPWSEGGVNMEVLTIPSRMVALAQRDMPESLAAFRDFGRPYYDSLAVRFPQTELGVLALGELGKLYGQEERWQEAIATLKRGTDSTGTVFPSYRIDIGEILASRLHDTAGALREFKDVAVSLPQTPFRVDADLKTAAIWMKRGRFEEAQALLGETKTALQDNPGAQLSVGPLLARAFAAAGNRERARAEFSYLIAHFPRTLQAVEAALALAELHAQSSEPGASQEWYDKADRLAADLILDREASPQTRGTAMNVRASLAVQSKRWDDAAVLLADIVGAFSPASPAGASALVRLGWLELQERHDTLAAARAWQVFLSAHPRHPDGEPLKSEMNKWPERYRENATS